MRLPSTVPDAFGLCLFRVEFGNDTQVGGAVAWWQGFVAVKVHDSGAGFRVREIASGQSISGLDAGGGVGARAELLVFEGCACGRIDDGVGAKRKTIYGCNEIHCVEWGGDVVGWRIR